jgi:hypothetical protein
MTAPKTLPCQHTAGPWHYDGPPHNHIVWSTAADRICFMAHSNGDDPVRDTANARLVAAAPEMLGALERIRNILRRLQPALNVMARDVLDDIIAFEIEPAIAKASVSGDAQ